MKYANFVHLHTHSQYSLLDGACRLDSVVELAKEYRMPALAITDHGNLVLDVRFPESFDPAAMETEIMGIPGVTANGIFTRPVNDLFIGHPDGRVEHKSK